MHFNWLVIFSTALIPLLVGFIWYNPSVFGNVWMKAANVSPDSGKGMNMPVVFGVSLLVAAMLAIGIMPMMIHQMGTMSSLATSPDLDNTSTELGAYFANYLEKYGQNFRTFKHGAFHGVLAALFFVLPVVTTSSLYERRGFKYIAVVVGYWIVTLALMGGVISAYA